jgi:tripartite-type tricarboxylate transporter receptor subunit TctC
MPIRFPYLSIIAISLAISAGVSAQGYPTKPIRIVIPTAPGGNPDFIARPVAQKMSDSMKQPIVIDNRPGAAGIIGVEYVARAAPDGYTILFGAIGHVATPSALHAKLAFDAIKDFAPIAMLAAAPFALFVHPSLPARSVQELVALAKARPGQINYASFGIGSFTHFVTESLSASVGIKMVHVPYKGSAPAAAALLAGEVVLSFDALQATLPQVQAKRLHALAIGAARRAPIAPDIPTFAEAGFANVTASAWFGLFAPAGTARDIVVKLHAEAVKALASPEIRDQFERAGIEPIGNTPEEFSAIVRSDIARFTRIAREAGIRAE